MQVLPYPPDDDAADGTNSQAHDAVSKICGISSVMGLTERKKRLEAHPVVLHRLAVTPDLYAVYADVAALAATLAPDIPIPPETPLVEAVRHDRVEGVQRDDAAADLAGDEVEEEPQPRATAGSTVGRKPKKDGSGFKLSGLTEGAKKGSSRTLYFKYEVVQHLRRMQALMRDGLCDHPNMVTALHFHVDKSLVTKWAKVETQLREALLHGKQVKHSGAKAAFKENIICFRSRAARRFTLHGGPKLKYAAAAAELYAGYKERRAKGSRVGSTWLRMQMKLLVRQQYGR